VSKNFGRIALAIFVSLALSVGLTAFAGSANAATSTTSCSSQHANVVKAKKHVAKDKRQLKKARHHHHKKAAKKAKRHLKRDRKKLHRAEAAYRACLNGQGSPSPAPTPTPAPNPVTAQCNDVAGQLAAQDPTGQFGTGSAAFCDLLGQLSAATGGDPTTLCDQLAAQDPTGQFVQICDGLAAAPLPEAPSLPGGDGGQLGGTLEQICDQLAAQDPTGQLDQLCTGLGTLPI
jgi:hypothetical protein